MKSTAQARSPRRRDFAAAAGTPPGSLRVSIDDTVRGAVITLKGYLDLATSPTLDAACPEVLELSRDQRVAADLTLLSFCDGAGVSTLLRFHRRARDGDGWLRLCAAGPGLRKVLRIADPATMLQCYPSPADAFADSHALGCLPVAGSR